MRQSDEYAVVGLFTTINSAFERVAMHAVRIELLREQARAVGLPLHLIAIPNPCSDEQYAAAMSDFMVHARDEGLSCKIGHGDGESAFGLHDVRYYHHKKSFF